VGDQAKQPTTNQPQTTERSIKQTIDRSNKRSNERTNDPTNERSNERTIERTIQRTNDPVITIEDLNQSNSKKCRNVLPKHYGCAVNELQIFCLRCAIIASHPALYDHTRDRTLQTVATATKNFSFALLEPFSRLMFLLFGACAPP